jgi:transposase
VNFAQAILSFLGIQDVTITDIKIWKKRGEVELKLKQNYERSYCQSCGLSHAKVHEWELRVLKAPPLGIFKSVTLKYKRLRGFCVSCNKNTLCVADFIHPEFKGYTCGFAEVAGRLMEETTCEASARLLDANSKSLWSLDQWRMKYLFQFMKLPTDMDVTELSADEVHFRSVKLERRNLFSKFYDIRFITNLVCTSNSKVLFNAPGRDSVAIEDALSVLSEGQKLAVEYFAVDMHDPFISVIKTECPNAKICVDRFHVAQSLNKAMERVRKDELKKATQDKDLKVMGLLSSSRKFVLFEKKKNLLKSEIGFLDKLRKKNKNINNGLLITEYFDNLLNKKTVSEFRRLLLKWYLLVRESKLKSFLKFAKTIRKYRINIEGYIKSRLTTAVSEGINNKIKVLKRMGYGYSNETSFRMKILQRCGFLNSTNINTRQLFYSVPKP